MSHIKRYISDNKNRFLEELIDFLKIPSIGADPSLQKELRKAALFVKEALLRAGVDKAELIETAGQPMVYGEKIMDPLFPTLLIYGHYDVQPADPEELWTTPPFKPTIRDGQIYARGACDDKGQVYAHIKALETMLSTETLPCNVKFLIEGEEEVGSPNITEFLQSPEHLDLIDADLILVSDTSMPSLDRPVIITSLRGIAMVQITVRGANRDLHSGAYGGAVANPINALCALIAKLKDDHHRITIPGFYDGIPTLSPAERAAYHDPYFDLAAYKADLGIQEVVGEAGYTTIEHTAIRPTLDVNGIWGGTIGKVKTVLPAEAHALVSMRLVDGQDAQQIVHSLVNYVGQLAKTLPALRGTRVQVLDLKHHNNALRLPTESKAVKASITAYEKGWGGNSPIIVGEGGSIPVLSTMNDKMKVPIALLGLGLDGDNIHSPNEHFGVENYIKGIETIAAFFQAYVQD